jgi:hypothetical protein
MFASRAACRAGATEVSLDVIAFGALRIVVINVFRFRLHGVPWVRLHEQNPPMEGSELRLRRQRRTPMMRLFGSPQRLASARFHARVR